MKHRFHIKELLECHITDVGTGIHPPERVRIIECRSYFICSLVLKNETGTVVHVYIIRDTKTPHFLKIC